MSAALLTKLQATSPVMQKLTIGQQRSATRLVLAPTSTNTFAWVAEALETLATTALSLVDKKALLAVLYQELISLEQSAFKGSFDIDGAVQVIWDTAQQKYSIAVKNTGCCPSCFSSAEVDYNAGAIQVNANGQDVLHLGNAAPSILAPTVVAPVGSGVAVASVAEILAPTSVAPTSSV